MLIINLRDSAIRSTSCHRFLSCCVSVMHTALFAQPPSKHPCKLGDATKDIHHLVKIVSWIKEATSLIDSIRETILQIQANCAQKHPKFFLNKCIIMEYKSLGRYLALISMERVRECIWNCVGSIQLVEIEYLGIRIYYPFRRLITKSRRRFLMCRWRIANSSTINSLCSTINFILNTIKRYRRFLKSYR